MKRARKLVTIIMISFLLLFVMLFADIVILGYLSIKTDDGMSQPSVGAIAGQLERTTDANGDMTYSLSMEGEAEIDRINGFAFLMNDDGDVIWSYHLPEDVPTHFTLKQVVQFTRFYLNDYPVFVHIIEDGILVVGKPKHTSWKYQLIFEEKTMNMFQETLPVMFVINIILILLVPFLLVRHDSRRREMERTTWIAGVSHDIRTPLSLVLGYADEILHIAEETGKSEKMGESTQQSIMDRAQIIEEQAVRIRTLVTNLNMENKLTYGMGGWKKETILLPAVIRDTICEMINRNMDDKYDIGVSISGSLEQLSVKGNKELIKRLLENLINNAVIHNPEGCEINVSLTSYRFLWFERYQLEVSDNGCGVSKKQLRSFRSLIKSDKLPEHGLGIRLVRQIASFHHWTVRFSNNETGGFCCRVYIL